MNEHECSCGNIKLFEVLSHPASNKKAVMCVECGNIWIETELPEPKDFKEA